MAGTQKPKPRRYDNCEELHDRVEKLEAKYDAIHISLRRLRRDLRKAITVPMVVKLTSGLIGIVEVLRFLFEWVLPHLH